MPEWEFLAAVAERADCGILLDVNNVFVCAVNHGFDAERYLDGMPAERVGQIHLAGHSDNGTHLLDTHDHPVRDEVWELYRAAVARFGRVSTLVEWDEHIPPFEDVLAEAERARAAEAEVLDAVPSPALRDVQARLLALADTAGRPALDARRSPSTPIADPAPSASAIYQTMYFWRLHEVLREDFPKLGEALGDGAFEDLARAYLAAHPSEHPSVRHLGRQLPGFLATRRPAGGAALARRPGAARAGARGRVRRARRDARSGRATSDGPGGRMGRRSPSAHRRAGRRRSRWPVHEMWADGGDARPPARSCASGGRT